MPIAMLTSLPLWILLCPLIGFFLNGVVIPLLSGGMGKTRPWVSGGIATLAMAASFVMSIICFLRLQGTEVPLQTSGFNWIEVGDLAISLNLRIDRLSSLMTLIIT